MSFTDEKLADAASWLASLKDKTLGEMTAEDWMLAVCDANRMSEHSPLAFHLLAALRQYGDERAREERRNVVETIASEISALSADGSEYHYALCWHLRRLADSLRRI